MVAVRGRQSRPPAGPRVEAVGRGRRRGGLGGLDAAEDNQIPACIQEAGMKRPRRRPAALPTTTGLAHPARPAALCGVQAPQIGQEKRPRLAAEEQEGGAVATEL
eukprot:861923_1